MSETYTHETTGIQAERVYWAAAGCTVYTTGTVSTSMAAHNFDALLLAGIEATGAKDHRAIVWAMQEQQRRKEEATRSTALAREAEAIQSLASSIRSAAVQESEDSLLARILPRLTERTQYAVRKQLGK